MGLKLRIVAGLVAVVIALLVVWSYSPHHEIRRGEHIEIQVVGTLLDQPISGIFRVDEDGKVTLGPGYGRVGVVGLDTDGATEAIELALRKVLRAPEVAVSRLGDDALSRLEAENRRLQAENAALKSRSLSTRVGANAD